MTKSPAELMKELKSISLEIDSIYEENKRDSYVELDENFKSQYSTNYNYDDNRERLHELQKREIVIHNALNKFNTTNYIGKYGITVAEALVKLGQLKREINSLNELKNRKDYFVESRSIRVKDVICHSLLDSVKIKDEFKKLSHEANSIQIEIDKVNLNSSIDC